MMNRWQLTIALCLVTLCLSAQKVKQEVTITETDSGRVETTVTTDKYKVETNYFFDNCFVTLGVGTEFYMGDNEKHMHFKDRLTPAVDFSIGKWFSPGWGLQLAYSGYKFKGLWADHYTGQHFKTDIVYPNPKKFKGQGDLLEQKAKFFNLHLDGLFNLTNIFCGYKEKRFYSCIPYMGVGWIRSYDHAGRKVGDITFNAGIINSFRLSDALDLNITIRGAIVDDGFDGEISGKYYQGSVDHKPEGLESGGQNYDYDGYGGIIVGLTYKFKERGWGKARSVKTNYTNEKELQELRDRVNALYAENQKLRDVPILIHEKENITIEFPYLVNFVIDKVEVVNRERVNLGFIAEVMKALPGKKFLITGYADKDTGTTKRNVWLGENRAKNVYKTLTEEFGVPAEQLLIENKGGVDHLFYDDPQLSRSAIITEIEE